MCQVILPSMFWNSSRPLLLTVRPDFSLSRFHVIQFGFCFFMSIFVALVNAMLNIEMYWILWWFLYNMHLLCMLNLYIVTFWPKTEILEFKLEWRFKIILRLYIEVGWAVSQLEGIDLIRSLTIYPIFMFWYMNVEWWYREYHYIMMQRKLSRFHFWYGVV